MFITIWAVATYIAACIFFLLLVWYLRSTGPRQINIGLLILLLLACVFGGSLLTAIQTLWEQILSLP